MKGRGGGCRGMVWLAGGSLGGLKGVQIAMAMMGQVLGTVRVGRGDGELTRAL
jgi:hypothetical protein